ncbi:MAG: hypothetical protein TREMPRED_001212 [Tremellales sp. Tagirdzhanova-0007]|nr:MAG: hypothetical protein TREMPRED_001212 [Tremellales sp. Tagirdzhanova-0007]
MDRKLYDDREPGLSLASMPRASDVQVPLMKKSLELPSSSRSAMAQAPAGDQKKITVPAFIILPTWIMCSISVILYNKFVFSSLDFPYPVFLTTFHLIFSALSTRVLKRFTTLIDGADQIQMTPEKWVKSILPIGILFSGSLIFSNYAYLSLSSFMPVAILLISFVFGLQEPNLRLVAIVFAISTGCALSAYGEIQFEMIGFLCQCAAIVFESSRLTLIQILLHGMKLDPLVSLHFYAPVCAVVNLCILPWLEGLAPFYALHRVGIVVLLSNAATAFALNVAAVFLIGTIAGSMSVPPTALRVMAVIIHTNFPNQPVPTLDLDPNQFLDQSRHHVRHPKPLLELKIWNQRALETFTRR